MEKRAMAVREEQWLQTIAAAKQSGQPIKVWCAEHGVPVSSFYKWQRKMRDSLLTAQIQKFNFRSWKYLRIYVVLQLQIESTYISRISW